LFWMMLRQFWSSWKSVLIVVKPDTVVAWHRAGFRWYWRWKSRRRRGRRRITPEIRELIVRLAEENTGWGAPKIHGELLKLGFDISERTVARYLRPIHRRGDPKRTWLTFLNNHREVIVALDFFTVPAITFQLLYCFFVIDHQRRKILHCNVTAHPTGNWVIQQLRETFSGEEPYRYVILDYDAKFNAEMIAFLKSTGLNPKRTSVQAPWQNGIAERWVGSARREILDHVIALNEDHIRRLLREYIAYHHEDRIHDALGKDTPNQRRSRTGLLRRRWPSQVPGSEVFIIDTPGARSRNRMAPRKCRDLICDFGALILLCLTDNRANHRAPERRRIELPR